MEGNVSASSVYQSFRGGELATRFFWAHLVSTALLCLFIPEPLGIPDMIGVSPERVLGYSWIANVEGVVAIYPDFFLLTWMLLPFWLLAFALCYMRLPYQIPLTSVNPWLVFVVALAVLALIVFADVDVSDNTGRGSRLVIAAAKSRLLGAVIFSAAATTTFVVCILAFVKTPIDFLKRPG